MNILDKLKRLLRKADFQHLIKMGAPSDEYDSEAQYLYEHISPLHSVEEIQQIIWNCFYEGFCTDTEHKKDSKERAIQIIGTLDTYKSIAKEIKKIKMSKPKTSKKKEPTQIINGIKIFSIPTYEEWIESLIEEKLYRFDKRLKKTKQPHMIMIKWMTGGINGGSCWDDGTSDTHYAMDGEPEPEFYELDKIFEAYWVDIPFLKYKEFCRNNVKFETDSVNEYYGNSSNYGIKTVYLQDLYNFLLENRKMR